MDGGAQVGSPEPPEFELEATVGIEPTIGVLQSAPRRPSASSTVHFISERAATQPLSSANIRSHPFVLLSVLLSNRIPVSEAAIPRR